MEAGLPVDLEQVETNFVLVDVGALGLGADEAVARLRAEGVLLSFAAKRNVLRAVTHLDVSAEDVEKAIERIPRALTGSPVIRRRGCGALPVLATAPADRLSIIGWCSTREKSWLRGGGGSERRRRARIRGVALLAGVVSLVGLGVALASRGGSDAAPAISTSDDPAAPTTTEAPEATSTEPAPTEDPPVEGKVTIAAVGDIAMGRDGFRPPAGRRASLRE